MSEQMIETSRLLNYSNLYLDFLNGESRLRRYLFFESPHNVAREIGPGKIDRGVLCDIMVNQNKDFHSKPKTFEAIDRLRRKNALCIFAGQQPGLLGGPLLTLYKAVDIVKRAFKLEMDLERPVIPIFWIACDDHDFDEINHTYIINSDNDLQKISYELQEKPAVAVAELCMSEETGYDAFAEQLDKAFAGTDFSKEHLQRMKKTYALNNSFVKSFARHLTDVLPDMGLVLFCPHNTEIKTLSKDFFRQIVERHFAIRSTLTETEQKLLGDGYHIQAEKKPSAVNLFFHDPDRKPMHFLDGSFHMGEKMLGLTGILDLIERNPEKFSPDVLTRPVWQSYLFPVVAQTGGPAEIAYFCQIGRLFELFNLVQPFYYPRTGATIVEKRHEDLLSKLDIKPEELSGDVEQVINKEAGKSFPAEVEKAIESFHDNLEKEYKNFVEIILHYEKSLEPMAEQTFGKIDFALNKFEKKIFSQHKKKTESVRGQIYKLANALFPERNFQERYLNINYFVSKYGYDIIPYIIDRLDIQTTKHQMIYLSDYGSQS